MYYAKIGDKVYFASELKKLLTPHALHARIHKSWRRSHNKGGKNTEKALSCAEGGGEGK